MTITNAKYVKNEVTGENCIIKANINNIEYCVPIDPENTEYAEILRQVELGNLEIEPADE